MEIIPFPNKKYSIIYADPPWDIGGYAKGTKKGIGEYQLPYSTMKDVDIINLPVNNITKKDAVLFLWCVDSRITILEKLMDSWGFQFKCLGFVWHKKAKTTKGDNAPYPMFTRRSCEYCFIGTRGKYLIKRHDINQHVSIPKDDHSSKPVVFRTLITDLCGNLPRIELFSRDNIDGWDAWGNQVPTHTQMLITPVEAYNPHKTLLVAP